MSGINYANFDHHCHNFKLVKRGNKMKDNSKQNFRYVFLWDTKIKVLY